ncbi:uncharacterized protein LOC110034447, partial [Phalaenopsis equestris]|uniref:uncharacterized protein LOC110034447 n=1 Tax=Phalaenopsis equestris TaxID=78828 RepID=UPI0009E56644
MALPGIGTVTKTSFTLLPPLSFCPLHRSSFAAYEALAKPDFLSDNGHRDQASSSPSTSPSNVKGTECIRRSLWKKMSSKELGIKKSMISKQTRSVLSELRRRGYDVYLVGGCVRDLIMRRVPKDFDIITTANLSEVLAWCSC